MARKATGRKPRRDAEGKSAANLINALKFVSVAQRKTGNPNQVHSVFHGGFVTAFDGLLTVGHPIDEDIVACPNTLQLLTALQKCGEQQTITQLDSGRLSVKSDKFRALIPCERFDLMPYVGPDTICASIDDRIKAGFEMVSPIVSDSADRMAIAGILLQANTTVATNGHVLLEYWHGIDLPPNIFLPKPAVKAILNVGKKLTHFGFSYDSATFVFEDRSYIKTQLIAERFVSYENVINVPSNPWPLPEGFYAAVDALESFSDNGILFFGKELAHSHHDSSVGASYELQGLPHDLMAFNAEYLQIVRKAFCSVDFQLFDSGCKAFFFGDNVRGALMGCSVKR